MTEIERLTHAIHRNTEVVALTGILQGASRCSRTECAHYATVCINNYWMSGNLCDLCTDPFLEKITACCKVEKEAQKLKTYEGEIVSYEMYSRVDRWGLPLAKQVRRLYHLLQGE
jgi:hypothetical protein